MTKGGVLGFQAGSRFNGTPKGEIDCQKELQHHPSSMS
jgi:hypothetical protein